MDNKWHPATRYIVGIGLFIFGLVVLYISRYILQLVVLAALIALLVRPLMLYLKQRLRFPTPIAVLVSYFLVALIILLAPLILLPPSINAVNFLLDLDYQALVNDITSLMKTTLVNLKESDFQLLGTSIILDSVIDPILLTLTDAGSVVTPELPTFSVIVDSIGQAFALSFGVAVRVVGTAFSGIVAFVFLIITSVYFSIDGEKFVRRFIEVTPSVYRQDLRVLLNRMKVIWGAFFRGQVTLMIIIGVVVWIGLTFLGVQGAAALGIISGLFEIIPNIGPFLAAIPAVIVALLQGSQTLAVNNFVFALIVIGFFVIIQFIENYSIVPRVMGDSVKLHPLVIILGVLVGATTWGILGALLAAPIIATGREIVMYLYLKVLGENPFPTVEIAPHKRSNISLRDSFTALKKQIRRLFIKDEKTRLPLDAQQMPDILSEEDGNKEEEI